MSKHFRAVKGPQQKPPRPLSPVSYAGPDDLDALLAFLSDVRDELGSGILDETLINDLAHNLTHRVGGVALIVKGPYGVEASMGLVADRPLFSREHRLKAAWLVVVPEARSTGHAKSLILEGRKFADALNRSLMIEEMTPDLESGKTKLISRHLRTAGAVFLHTPALAVV